MEMIKRMKNAVKDTFIYLGLIFLLILFATAAIKSAQPTEQDLARERDRLTTAIQGNTEITVSSERELQIVKEILDSQGKEIVDVIEESKLAPAPGRVNQLLPKAYWKVTYKPKDL